LEEEREETSVSLQGSRVPELLDPIFTLSSVVIPGHDLGLEGREVVAKRKQSNFGRRSRTSISHRKPVLIGQDSQDHWPYHVTAIQRRPKYVQIAREEKEKKKARKTNSSGFDFALRR